MTRKFLLLLGLPLLAFVFVSQYSSRLATTINASDAHNKNESADLRAEHGERNEQSTPQKRKISLIVRLRGEMANHLSLLAFAKGVQLWIHEHHPHLTVELVGERQSGIKWKSAVGAMQKCFPNLRDLDFQGGRWDPDFVARNELSNAPVSDGAFNGITISNRRERSDSTIAFSPDNFGEIFDRGKLGGKHTIPISTSMNVLKYFTLSPSFNYEELWYTKELDYTFIPTENAVPLRRGPLRTRGPRKRA